MRISCLTNGPFGTNCYILEGDEVVLIDAPAPAGRIIERLKAQSLTPSWVLLTHGHADHVMALHGLKEAFPGLKTAISEADKDFLEARAMLATLSLFSLSPGSSDELEAPAPDLLIKDGDSLPGGLMAISTPGHTAGSLCFLNQEGGFMFSGDTLFAGSVGRTDLGGDAGMLMSSLKRLCALVGDDVDVLPGHGPYTKMGLEKKTNPYL